MAVAITGANGFVGGHVKQVLSERGFEVLTLARGVYPLPLLQRANILIHLAARVHVMDEHSSNPLAEFRQANVTDTIILARQAAAAGVTRFVFISSVKVNGEETQPDHPFTEIDAPNPVDAYAQSKYEAELALREVAVETGLEVVIIRPPLVYGPGVKANFASLMNAVVRRLPLPFGAVKNLRSLVGLDNLVDFIHCCMLHPSAANETFLVSDASDLSTPQLISELAQAAGVKPNLCAIPPLALEWAAALVGRRSAMQRLCGNLQVDVTKARVLLGWQPPVSLQDGFKKTIAKG